LLISTIEILLKIISTKTSESFLAHNYFSVGTCLLTTIVWYYSQWVHACVDVTYIPNYGNMKRKLEFPLSIPPWQGNYESEIGAIYY
jgi:hypothetical protein